MVVAILLVPALIFMLWLLGKPRVLRRISRASGWEVALLWAAVLGGVAASGKWGPPGLIIGSFVVLPFMAAILTLARRDLRRIAARQAIRFPHETPPG